MGSVPALSHQAHNRATRCATRQSVQTIIMPILRSFDATLSLIPRARLLSLPIHAGIAMMMPTNGIIPNPAG
jgi:hypothetical protein